MNIIKLHTINPTWRKVYWNNDPLIQRLSNTPNIDIDDLSKDELIHLVKELDRRFMQLWDKIEYENLKIH